MSSATHFYPYAASKSLIESLPSELLRKILNYMLPSTSPETSCHISAWPPAMDVNAINIQSPTLTSCLLASRTMHVMALTVMYRNVTISQSLTFEKLSSQLRKYLPLGESVRRLNLSQIRKTGQEGACDCLLATLNLTPLIREFRIHYDSSIALDQRLLQKLFCELPYLEALQLLSYNSPTFTQGLSNIVDSHSPISKSLKSLSLNGCDALPPAVFESILSQLPQLQVLDVAYTQVTSHALSMIPATARLTSLNISYCISLSGKSLAEFLIIHPSMRNSIVDLNVETWFGTETQVLDEQDISKILGNIPATLRVLNLKNSPMNSTHFPHLCALSGQLRELSVGTHLGLRDIERLLASHEDMEDEDEEAEEEDEPREMESKYQNVLNPMAMSVAVCKIRRRINSVPEDIPGVERARFRYLDISSMPLVEQEKIRTSVLLGEQSLPLEVIEISATVLRRCEILPRISKSVGWEVKSVGKRCWLKRNRMNVMSK